MLIEKQYKIEESASTDSCRQIINHIKIDEFNGKPVAVATDGRILACVPVEATPQEYGLLGISALKLARQTTKQPVLSITLSGTQDLANGVKLPRPEGEYPNWKQVIPAADRPVAFRCCFDPFLLASLCKSLGIGTKSNAVTLEFGPDLSGGHPDTIVVKGAGGTFGVLSPMRIG